ncbi:hypothetical protein DB88DRAFT_466565 [Papiliotrema laurentii]|uniref:Anti-proliferative protein domain-containing protein n=1 Tax=Papiliotrema laurentii TaxID=5418 RepID=A0AAD9CXP9_PAPLA|nr:hypothetical protein DB88DRAFT_466565 [Papiliotrema laurentii]
MPPPPDGLDQKLQALDLSPHNSPALSHRTAPSIHSLDLDLTLSTAVSHLINHLLQPLNRLYPAQTISDLRLHLTNLLTELYAPTWNTAQPQLGSGFRSLICTRHLGLPRVLRQAAKEAGVDEVVWRKALGKRPEEDPEGRYRDEWEAWCDPGTVVWRDGGWEWEDPEFDPFKAVKGKYQIIWSSSSSPKPAPPTVRDAVPTPSRPSHAIPIRAPVPLPAVFAIPPTPATGDATAVEAPLLPSVAISRSPSPSASDASSGYRSGSPTTKNQSRTSSNPTSISSRGSHRGTGSTSSNGSSESETSAQQLLTPKSRPPSVDPFASDKSNKSVTPTQRGRDSSPPNVRDPATSTPTVTPYDGGNVTVLGGGVKLGGISRPSSVMSVGRNGNDRSRSPSISLASRALTSALGPNGQPTGRKTRTRRRIMPTYLGHLGQPGVGGPMGAFVPAIQPGWQGVGVGMAPPPISAMTRPLGQPRVTTI